MFFKTTILCKAKAVKFGKLVRDLFTTYVFILCAHAQFSEGHVLVGAYAEEEISKLSRMFSQTGREDFWGKHVFYYHGSFEVPTNIHFLLLRFFAVYILFQNFPAF